MAMLTTIKISNVQVGTGITMREITKITVTANATSATENKSFNVLTIDMFISY